MEFMSRGTRPVQSSNQPAGPNPSTNVNSSVPKESSKLGKLGGFSHFANIALLLSVAVLVLAVTGTIFLGKPASEYRAVDKNKMQAVFLAGGQVYFGRIASLNPQFMRVGDIYYLRVNQQVQPGQEQGANDVSLVKLGCELHGPTDEMVINREQVIFWENLKDDGQVAKAVADYKKQNPDGQKCEQPQQQSTNNEQQPATQQPTQTNTPTNTNQNQR